MRRGKVVAGKWRQLYLNNNFKNVQKERTFLFTSLLLPHQGKIEKKNSIFRIKQTTHELTIIKLNKEKIALKSHYIRSNYE